MKRLPLSVFSLLFVVSSFTLFPSPLAAQQLEHRIDAISGGAEASARAQRVTDVSGLKESPIRADAIAGFTPGVGFLAYNFDNNITETGFTLIPPDPIGSAGPDRVIAVVNVGIECRNKAGTLIFRDALKDFFNALGAQTLGTLTFDPKVVYDHYEGRFVVVTLERRDVALFGDASDDSRILVAVSKTSSPATATSSDWYYHAINSKINIGGTNTWADYPGFEVDEEAVYITNNMYGYGGGAFQGTRLWIINKGVVGGFYAGSAAGVTVHDPIPATFFAMTLQPALVFGAGGVGTGIGTFLVGYSNLTFGGVGGNELVQVIQINNPLGAVTFTGQTVNVGDIEDVGVPFGFPNIPDAPQNGTTTRIEVNDSRALDAVWRNNSLWFTTTINPNTAYDATNTGQATAHWFRLDTSAIPSPITLADQGNIGGEDIASNTWTFFPAVAVNGNGDAKFGFAASAATIYGGAYYAGRHTTDTPGTVQASGTVKAGLDQYQRTFGLPRNRWGDYSGASVDPSDDLTFWIFNEYAETRGLGTAPEDGRWGTAWKQCLINLDFGDAPDPTYPTLLTSNGARHEIVPGVFMGLMIDPEINGLPHPQALGDDLTGLPDEDGVAFVTPLIPGQPATMNVTTSVGGQVDAWIDFNANGTWLDPGEWVFSGFAAPGLNPIPIAVPALAMPGFTFARIRYNVSGIVLQPTGFAPDGEVEDYRLTIEEEEQLDFGDAPDPTYPTLLASNGAWHPVVPGVFMGGMIDSEPDGQPHPDALGDDMANQPDEDGVIFVTPIIPGLPAQVDVITSIAGWIDMWFDFDANGSWLDPGEQVFTGPAVLGLNPIPVNVPATAVAGSTFVRVRFNTIGPLTVGGGATDGEVEDYEVIVEELDFGDAPDPTYPTLLVNDGARHVVITGFHMGASIDGEPDGQPSVPADGDDIANLPDEDGVIFTSLLDPSFLATVDVIVVAAGSLDAWIDFDTSGTWDASEQIFTSVSLLPGVNSLQFNVPPIGKAAPDFDTYARFRFSSVGGLQPAGIAFDGEVEDYVVHIEPDVVTTVGGRDTPSQFALHNAVPNPFNPQTKLSFSLPKASHVRLIIFDVRGRLVTTLRDRGYGPGRHDVIWQGRNAMGRPVSSGVYLYRIEADGFTETKRMVLIK